MSNKMKLKRIVDLFTQGAVCYLGDDEQNKPVCVWVQKTTSLEEDEARLDGQSARTEFLLAVANPMHAEMQHLHLVMSEWTDDELYEAASNHNYEKCVLEAANDIESDKEWVERLEYLRRQPALLDDAKVSEDDPRRKQLSEYNEQYLEEIHKRTDEKINEHITELKAKGRSAVEEEFVKEYKDKIALDHYMMESRVTKLYYAVRECEAMRKEDGEWDHKTCDHRNRLMENRQEVRELPEDVLAKIIETYEEAQVGMRNVANFPEVPSSSESSATQKEDTAA